MLIVTSVMIGKYLYRSSADVDLFSVDVYIISANVDTISVDVAIFHGSLRTRSIRI